MSEKVLNKFYFYATSLLTYSVQFTKENGFMLNIKIQMKKEQNTGFRLTTLILKLLKDYIKKEERGDLKGYLLFQHYILKIVMCIFI